MPTKWFEYVQIGDDVIVYWWDSEKQENFEKRLTGGEAGNFLAFVSQQQHAFQQFAAQAVS